MTDTENKEATYDEKLAKVRELVKEIDLCMLTTVDENGKLNSRPMSNNRDVDFDGDLWFYAREDSHKAHEIEGDKRVNVSFANTGKHHYVSLSGTAEIIRDKAEIEKHWTPSLNVWFPDGTETPGVILLKVQTESAEYWESPGKLATGFAILKGLATRTEPDFGANESFEIK